MENRIEIWKHVVGYEGLYEVSSLGRVRSLDRYDGRAYKRSRILKPRIHSNYLAVNLCNGGKCREQLIHRLVAKTFIPNPNNLPMVNHKDENKLNNMIWINEDGSIDYDKSNLEWCDAKYNRNYGSMNEKLAKHFSKPILQFSNNNKLIKKWDSIREAERHTGVYNQHICACCQGKIKSAGGYIWKYYGLETYLIGIMNNNIKRTA